MKIIIFPRPRPESPCEYGGAGVEPPDLGCVKSGTVGEVFTDHATRVRVPGAAAHCSLPPLHT